MDNKTILFDRINIIRDTINCYGADRFYVSFSGGKDSVVLSKLIDLALPNNNIPRLFFNTGIEYIKMVEFVKDLASVDDRIKIINSNVNIHNMFKKYGYPFKSKLHSQRVAVYQRNGYCTDNLLKYISGTERIRCPEKLLYQFSDECNLKISAKCCYYLKKKVSNTIDRIPILAIRKDEGGARYFNGKCVTFSSDKNILSFNPLLVVSNEFEDWFIEKYNLRLCDLYYPPYNFKRTGCKGCPYSLTLQQDLDSMKQLLPLEYKICNVIWKPVYDEYRRLGYRLRKEQQ